MVPDGARCVGGYWIFWVEWVVHFQKCGKSIRETFVVIDSDKEAGYVHGEFRSIGDGDDSKNRLILSPTKQKRCWK